MSTAQSYSGINSYIFAIDEIAGYGKGGFGGTIASPAPPDAGDLHIPFNPFTTLSIELPKYGIMEKTYVGNSLPTRQSTILELGTLTLTTDYHAPFIMSRFFTGKHYDGTWSASPETVTMGLENWETTTNSLALHLHLDNRDSTADDIDLNVYGGFITSYKWSIAQGDSLQEEIGISFSNWDEGAIAFNADTSYHNQKYALWNSDRILDSTKVLSIEQHKVTISTVAALDAAIACYTEASITLKSERETATCLGNESTNFSEKKGYDVEATMTIKPKDNYPLTEFRLRFEERDDVTFKFLITEGTRTEYIQCTKMKLHEIGPVTIPEPAGDATMGLSLVFLPTDTSVVTYSGSFDGTATATPVVADKPGYIKYLA